MENKMVNDVTHEYKVTDIDRENLITVRNELAKKYSTHVKKNYVSAHIPEESETVRNVKSQVCYQRGRAIFYKIEAELIILPFVVEVIDGVLEGKESAIGYLVNLDANRHPLISWDRISAVKDLSDRLSRGDFTDAAERQEVLVTLNEELTHARENTAIIYESLKSYVQYENKTYINTDGPAL